MYFIYIKKKKKEETKTCTVDSGWSDPGIPFQGYSKQETTNHFFFRGIMM